MTAHDIDICRWRWKETVAGTGGDESQSVWERVGMDVKEEIPSQSEVKIAAIDGWPR